MADTWYCPQCGATTEDMYERDCKCGELHLWHGSHIPPFVTALQQRAEAAEQRVRELEYEKKMDTGMIVALTDTCKLQTEQLAALKAAAPVIAGYVPDWAADELRRGQVDVLEIYPRPNANTAYHIPIYLPPEVKG